MIAPVLQSEAEAVSQHTHLALMWSLSYPGRIHRLPRAAGAHGGLMTIAEALLDLETSTFTPDAGLARHLAQTGARQLAIGSAAYIFLPELDEAALALVAQVNLGTHAFPDEGATVICGCAIDARDAPAHGLRGPGVDGQRTVQLGRVPEAFWGLRASLIRYPLGFDVFFVDDDRVIGLPRTTEVA